MNRSLQATFGRHSEAVTQHRFSLDKSDANKVVHPTRPFPPMDERPVRPDPAPRPVRESNPGPNSNPPDPTRPPDRRENP
jgi:hypothetical protein